ncbi:MAG: LacI family DNA-binding transcriptional regulator [Acidimicrobiales bacterium]
MSEETYPRRRVTISDIALRAGVSKGAVSYALNGRPGISEATRIRILKISEELGWYPNSAARALSAARAGACGLVLARGAHTLAFEPFFMQLMGGIEAELSSRSVALTIQVVDDVDAEMAVYRRWWAEHRVDGVLVVDLRIVDPRVQQIEHLGLPAVIIGGPEGTGGLSAVWSDDAGAVVDVIRYLARLGHERIARVAGVPEFLHTEIRTGAFLATMAELSLSPQVITTDYMAETGAKVTRQLLSEREPPTAIVYDNDVLAVAGLGVAHEMGLSVPDDVSVVAWDDSLYTQAVHPPLSAVTRDIVAMGMHAASALLTLIDEGVVTRMGEPPGQLIPRGTTARLPRSSRVPDRNSPSVVNRPRRAANRTA